MYNWTSMTINKNKHAIINRAIAISQQFVFPLGLINVGLGVSSTLSNVTTRSLDHHQDFSCICILLSIHHSHCLT